MLFWIILAVAIVGIIWLKIDSYSVSAFGLCLIGLIMATISVFTFIACNIGVDGYVAGNKARYDSLVYQYENNIYDNDNDLGKRELMVDIQEWNEDLAKYKEIQDDFWIGIYIPNVFDQFEFIELK